MPSPTDTYMKLNFLQDAFVLPGAVLTHCSGATAEQIKVLLWLASDLSLAEKPKQLAKLADCDAKAVKGAIQYWQRCGVLGADGEEALPVMAQAETAQTKETVRREKIARADVLPQYTTTELADLLESRASVRVLVDESQRILGKMFHPAEINVLLGMLDYLGMSEECVLMLLAHCKKIGKTNLRAIEKYAIGLSDRGISDAAAMEEELRTLEALHSFEGEVRTLFGMKSRALTAKESKMLRAWVSYGYGIEMVRRAYELTVDATNEPSMAYANAILERWNAEGVRTPEDVDAETREKADKKNGNGKTLLGNSFDTDDFFEAAIKRSFRDADGN